MANVINRITKKYLTSVNTPDYPITEWIINPILPDCGPEHYVIEDDTVREMNVLEKFDLVYSTESTAYLIIEKQLIIDINGHDYETNSNAVINPTMPECEIKYTKMADGLIVEISAEEKHIIDLPELKREWIANITNEVYKTHSVEEVAFLALLVATEHIQKTNHRVVSIKNTVIEALGLYPKPE